MIDDKNTQDDKIIENNFATRNELEGKGKIILNTSFDSNTMENIFFKIQKAAEDNNIKEIQIFINSNGGNVDALMPLVDLIDSFKDKKIIKTIVLGKAFSAGAMLLLCGHKGQRFAYAHSEILIHEVASGTNKYCKNSQMQLDAKWLARTNELLADLIKQRTKMSSKDIAKFMNSNTDEFISAQQALKFGIIDKIL